MYTTEDGIFAIVLTCVICSLVSAPIIYSSVKMSKFQSYDNKKNIKKAQRKLDKLTRKSNPDLSKIALAQKELETAKLFSNCQRIFIDYYDGGSASVLFSDDNKVMMFVHDVIPYSEIKSFSIVENNITKSHTKTKLKGAIPGAIIGGILGGAVGAFLGGMTAEPVTKTTYYQATEGFYFQLFLKNKTHYTVHFRGRGIFSDKIPRNWERLSKKIQTVIRQAKRRMI